MEMIQHPNVVQALPATLIQEPEIIVEIIQALPATPKEDKEPTLKMIRDSITERKIDSLESFPASINTQKPTSSRCTRSQAAPDWTNHETLILVNEIAAMDEHWLKALSAYQKWKIISDSCIASGVARSSNQCKRKWDSLLADYKKIRKWELKHEEGTFWSLGSQRKKQLGLPFSFDQEVFGAMQAVIGTQEAQAESVDSDSEDLIAAADGPDVPVMNTTTEMLNTDTALGPVDKVQGDMCKAWCITNKLQEDAERIQCILSGEMKGNASHSFPVDMTKPNAVDIEFTRRQADQLIKSLGGLVGNLNELSELIKSGKCEGIKSLDSMAL